MFVNNASIHSFIFGRSKKVDHSDTFENSTEMSNDSTDSSFTKAKKNFTPGILFTLLVESTKTSFIIVWNIEQLGV